MRGMKFEEDGTPSKHSSETWTFEHLGKKVKIQVHGLEVELRMELKKIVQNYLDNSEVPRMLVTGSYLDFVGVHVDEQKQYAIGRASFDCMLINNNPFYKVKDFKILAKYEDKIDAANAIRKASEHYVLSKLINKIK